MVDWLQIRKRPIEEVRHGVEQASTHFESGPWIGPRTYDRLDYPAAEVLPDETARTDATNWTHTIVVNLYFERSRDMDYIEDVLHPTAAVLDEVLTALGTVDCLTNYHPESIQDFAGELDNTSVLLVSIRFRAQSLADPSTF